MIQLLKPDIAALAARETRRRNPNEATSPRLAALALTSPERLVGAGSTFQITTDTTTIGRGADNAVVVSDQMASGHHAATLSKGKIGILHGMKSYFLQDKNGQIKEAHSISAGLDYPGVGPEHAYLKDNKRVNYSVVTDDEAMKAFLLLSKLEGIIPALESSHAIAYLMKHSKRFVKDTAVVVTISGRGDKDLQIVREKIEEKNKVK